MHPIVALWAHPRSLSTVLERVFMERGDFTVMHEPFSVVYYVHEQRAAAVQANLNGDDAADYDSVRSRILTAADERPVCFKDMCYHCHDHLVQDGEFLSRLINVFLIRDPAQSIASHYAKNSQVTSEEIGYEKLASVFRRVNSQADEPPVVIAAEDLQQRPRTLLKATCDRLQLADRPDAMNWDAGQRSEWTLWENWHEEVARSSGINRSQTVYADTVENHSGLAAFYSHHRPFYEEMHKHRLRFDS